MDNSGVFIAPMNCDYCLESMRPVDDQTLVCDLCGHKKSSQPCRCRACRAVADYTGDGHSTTRLASIKTAILHG